MSTMAAFGSSPGGRRSGGESGGVRLDYAQASDERGCLDCGRHAADRLSAGLLDVEERLLGLLGDERTTLAGGPCPVDHDADRVRDDVVRLTRHVPATGACAERDPPIGSPSTTLRSPTLVPGAWVFS